MPVIINETDIVVEPPPAPAQPAVAPPRPQLTPEEVLRVVERQHERLARVWAD